MPPLVGGDCTRAEGARGSAALDADDYLIYNPASDELLYDADGNGAGSALRFALVILAGDIAPSASDFLILA